MTDTQHAVRLERVVKRFGAVEAVAGVDLEVAEGEFFSMLGPSGSGKTTCLRMIAGFEAPTEGRVFLGGTDVTDRPPYERDVNTVFQDYALFPHMTVAENVGYGLLVKRVAADERHARVADALVMVRLDGYGDRRPSELSGGQRQRVALARALVNRPEVLLLDEPLGALDLKLRQAMQVELKQIQREVGLTFVYVTHDQEEALTMSDRLAVFNAGRIEQVHGGVSRNVVEDIANVELRPTFVGLVDDTGMGQDVIDKLARHKVNTRFIQKKPDGMGTWLAIFDNDGDVHAAISKRPDTTPLTGLLQEQGDEIFADCDSIALELDLEKETVKQTLRYAKKYGKKVFAVVSNMSIAMERRDFLQQIDCFICNQQEAGLLFSDDYDHLSPDEMCRVLTGNVRSANIPSMVVTMGGQGAVYACADGDCGIVPAKKVDVMDTTGAGDAFFAGTVIGLTYGKTLAESCEIGSRLAASVICITENVCPRFRPQEFGLDVPVVD